MVLCLVLSVLVPLVGPGDRAARAGPDVSACRGGSDDPGFPCVAEFNFDGDKTIQPGRLVIDSGLGRLVACCKIQSSPLGGITANVVYQLDLKTGTMDPRQVKRTDIAALANAQSPRSPFGDVLALDDKGHRLFLAEGACIETFPRCERVRPRVASVSLVDAFAPKVAFQFPTGFEDHDIAALVYDTPRDVLYAMTYRPSGVHPGNGNTGENLVTTVHAFDLAPRAGSPADGSGAAHLWSMDVGSCPGPVGPQTYLGIARAGDLLSFPCGGGDAEAVQSRKVQQHGVVVIGMKPGWAEDDRSPQDRDRFAVEFHPFPGNLGRAVSGGDPHGEKLFVLSSSLGQERVFVFDVRQRAWTGSRPLGSGNIRGVAVDHETGRAYTFQQDPPQVFVMDAAIVPMPNGQSVDPGVQFKKRVNGAVDPNTRRVFVPGQDFTAKDGNTAYHTGVRIYQDRTEPPPAVLSPGDPDERTNDIDETVAGQVVHGGIGSSYGTRLLFVGGVNASPAAALSETEGIVGETGGGVEGGDRDVLLGFVPEAELSGDRNRGLAVGNAVGARLGDSTEADLASKSPGCHMTPGRFPAEFKEGCEDTDFDESAPLLDDQLMGQIHEFGESRCRAPGAAQEQQLETDGSRVACEPLKMVSAGAWSSERMQSASLSVAFTASDVRVVLDPARGAVTEATAVARGIHVVLPGAGEMVIGEVRTAARTWAHGRPGSAGSSYTVSINNVRISSADGQATFACGWNTDDPNLGVNSEEDEESTTTRADDPGGRCDPRSVTDAINRQYAFQLRAELPRRDTSQGAVGSPRGAQAIVTKDPFAVVSDGNMHRDDREELAGLTIVFYGDGRTPSRAVLQLAGVRAESHYEIGVPRLDLPDTQVAVRAHDAPPKNSGLRITLGDLTGAPLAGGAFEVFSDVDADSRVSRADILGAGRNCMTGADGVGDCDFKLEPGTYVIREARAPNGFKTTDDLPLTLTPGFTADVAFMNVRASAQNPMVLPSSRTRPIVNIMPLPPTGGAGGDRLWGLPADVVDFLRRHLGQALLFALLWMLIGAPAYLAMRRRDLLTTRRAT